jgi:hypothetical protein
MAGALAGIVTVQPAYQPQHGGTPKQAPKEAATHPRSDVVTISAQGKQAAKQIQAQAGKK